MAFVLQYWPPILAGMLLAVILTVFLVSSLRAQRRHTTPPRAIWTTLVFAATTWSLTFFEMYFRAPPGDEMFWKDMMVALGTMLAVWVAVAVALTYFHGRSTPPMTETEREAWLERSTGDLDVLAKFFVGTHALTLTYGAFVLVALLLIALIWALAR